MRPIEAIALGAIKAGAKQRDQVSPGEYELDFIVRVQGELAISEDVEAIVSTAIPWQRVAAVALDKLNGVTLESVLREALEGEVDEDAIGSRAAEAMETLKGTTRRTRKGAVRAKLVAEVVELELPTMARVEPIAGRRRARGGER